VFIPNNYQVANRFCRD